MSMERFQNVLFEPPLRPFIEAYWEMERIEPKLCEIPIAAVAVMHIIFHAGALSRHRVNGRVVFVPKIALAGIVDKSGQTLTLDGHFITYGISFTPLGLFHLLDVKPALFSNVAVDYHAICNEPLPELFTEPKGQEGMEARSKIAQDWCQSLYLKKAKPLTNVEKLMLDIRESLGQAKVLDPLHRKTPRQVQRKFREIVGITAKHYAKLLRFNAAQALLSKNPNISLLEAAVQTGYYDAAHLSHDFKELNAPLPGAWAKDPQSHTSFLIDPLKP